MKLRKDKFLHCTDLNSNFLEVKYDFENHPEVKVVTWCGNITKSIDIVLFIPYEIVFAHKYCLDRGGCLKNLHFIGINIVIYIKWSLFPIMLPSLGKTSYQSFRRLGFGFFNIMIDCFTSLPL